MEQVPVELARWAVGPGLAVVADVTRRLDEGEGELAVGTRLREQHDVAQAAFAVAAAVARRRARELGVAAADELVLTREALEQASNPAVAAWRATQAAAARRDDEPVVDLCAGTGADAVALAAHGPVVAVEADPGRAVLAAHRAQVLGLDVEVVVGDALAQQQLVAGRVVHADPDRRDAAGRRARTLRGHRPPVGALLGATADARGRLVTVAPGTAWDDPDLPDADVAFVQHDGTLVEAVLRTGDARESGARATAVLLPSGRTWTRPTGERERVAVRDVGAWLVDPSPALVRARLHDELARSLGAGRLARRRALLTTDAEPPHDDWYRAERVVAVLGARPKELRAHRRATGEERPVEVVLHGADVDVRRWLRGAGAPPTGPHGQRVHVVRRDDDTVVVVTDGVGSTDDRGGGGTVGPPG